MIWRHRGLFVVAILAFIFLAYTYASRLSEVVHVKYRGDVNLAPFECTAIDRSSFVKRICYDRSNSYMLINLNGTYYHYCEIDGETAIGLLHAESVGRFFNANIRGRFDCRTHHVPNY
jgi:KTSC domain